MSTELFHLINDPVVTGSLSLTTDSFISQSVAHGEYIARDGAAIIEVGYNLFDNYDAAKITTSQEIEMVVPVIEALAKRIGTPISVCTSSPEVMEAAVSVGARMINDILALSKPGAVAMAVKLGVPVCLVHNQISASYKDVVNEVYAYLEQRIKKCIDEGVDPKNIIIDPGFGLAKNLQHNLSILKSLQIFKKLNSRLSVGLWNKSIIGQILEVPIDQRVYGTIAAEVIAIVKGADIVRTHQIKATMDAIKIIKALSA